MTDGWHYIEIYATIDASVGRATIRLDGSSTPAIDFTGNTRNGGTNLTIDAIRLGAASNNNPTLFDDLYVCNSLGGVNNTFLGDMRVQTSLPIGAGSDTQWAVQGAASNYLAVDDSPYNSADYVYATTTGQRDLYALGDLSATTASVKAVQSNIVAMKGDAGTVSIKPALKAGGTIYYDSTLTLSPSAVWTGDVREVNPATAVAWTASDVNSLEAGVEVA
jgi:hypothetical protein